MLYAPPVRGPEPRILASKQTAPASGKTIPELVDQLLSLLCFGIFVIIATDLQHLPYPCRCFVHFQYALCSFSFVLIHTFETIIMVIDNSQSVVHATLKIVKHDIYGLYRIL